jgi:hypothetical protein
LPKYFVPLGIVKHLKFTTMELETLKQKLPTMKLYDIATLIMADWKNMYFGAKPYVSAMLCISDLTSPYGCENGKTQVRYFLGNAQTWRGETAKTIKAELNKRLKQSK